MNKKSLIAAGLLALGTAFSAKAVVTNVVTITGSTAFRAVIYTACTTPGMVFVSHANNSAAVDPIVLTTPNNNGANDIVFQGYLTNSDGTLGLYDLVASWTGSEAGIAAVAQVASIANPTPVFNGGTSPLPGVPPKYLTQASGWTTKGDGTTTFPSSTDLAMSDTSQAVSLTKNTGGNTALVIPGGGNGIVGIVPFMWMKGHNSAPATSSWGHLVNITHPAAALCILGAQVPRLFTGNAADPDTDSVIVVGRNIGSGTHVNQMLDLALKTTLPVDQFVINTTYSGSGVLTQNGVIAYNDGQVLEVGPDGFDSGGSVAACLKCDGTGSSMIPIGFLGIPDAIGLPIHTGGAEASGAVILTLDGVTESNGAIENAQYTAWGHEHIYGKHGQLSTDFGGIVGAAMAKGVPAALTFLGWGVGASTQDAAIPTNLMHADKNGDVGYPAPQ